MKLCQINIKKVVRDASIGLCLSGSLWAQGTVVETNVLPSIDLATFQNNTLPGSITVGANRGFKLGGIGSGIFNGPGDGKNTFWMITDRGPNPQDVGARRAFPVPEFTPHILQVRAENGTIQILKALPLTGSNGAGVSGLPNDPISAGPAYPLPLRDEVP